jgi:hypothetical protein
MEKEYSVKQKKGRDHSSVTPKSSVHSIRHILETDVSAPMLRRSVMPVDLHEAGTAYNPIVRGRITESHSTEDSLNSTENLLTFSLVD